MTGSETPETPETVISVDPGSVKCGLAVVAGPEIRRLSLSVVETERLVVEVADARRRFPQITRLLIGSGTRSAPLRRALQAAFPDLPLQVVDEYGSSQRARQRFVAEIPGPGWRRFLPAGLRVPERPYDDFVALLLAEDYFSRNVGTNPPNS
jgi:RNase H-fold protein (predicted Holliday junction resolvase)